MIGLVLLDGRQRIDLFAAEGESDGIEIFLRCHHGTVRFPARVETSPPSVLVRYLDVLLNVDLASILGRRMLLQKTPAVLLLHAAGRTVSERLGTGGDLVQHALRAQVMGPGQSQRALFALLGYRALVLGEKRFTLDPVDHRFAEIVVSHHVLDAVFGLRWSAMRGYIE